MNSFHSIPRRSFLFAVAACAAAGSVQAQIQAQSQTPLRIIVALSAGSASDTLARYVAKQLEPLIGRPVIVENLPGGDMVRGTLALTSSPADGNTVLVVSPTSVVINPLINDQLPYDPQRDIRPIAGMTRGAAALVTRADGKFKSLADVLSFAKKNPRVVSIGTYGHHYRMGAAVLGREAGVEFNLIPYKGGAQLVTDVVGGSLDLALLDIGGAMPLVKGNKLLALATTGRARHADLPDVVTVREAGFPDYTLYGWAAFAVRSGTPEPVALSLETVFRKVTADPAFTAFLIAQQNGHEVIAGSGKDIAAMIDSEVKRYKSLPPGLLQQQ